MCFCFFNSVCFFFQRGLFLSLQVFCFSKAIFSKELSFFFQFVSQILFFFGFCDGFFFQIFFNVTLLYFSSFFFSVFFFSLKGFWSQGTFFQRFSRRGCFFSFFFFKVFFRGFFSKGMFFNHFRVFWFCFFPKAFG